MFENARRQKVILVEIKVQCNTRPIFRGNNHATSTYITYIINTIYIHALINAHTHAHAYSYTYTFMWLSVVNWSIEISYKLAPCIFGRQSPTKRCPSIYHSKTPKYTTPKSFGG